MKVLRLVCLAFVMSCAQLVLADTPTPTTSTGPTNAPALTAATGSTNTLAPTPTGSATGAPKSAAKTTREGARLSRPIQEVVTMANAGVPQEVLVSYVQNSQFIFSPTPQNIIYLKDIGFPVSVITAMFAHDKALRDSATHMGTLPPVNFPPQIPVQQYQPSQQPYPSETPSIAPTSQTSPDTNNGVPQSGGPQYDNSIPPQATSFYNDLAPYGSWYSLPGYGWAWQPSNARSQSNWAPYCNDGRWLYSNCGWYWNSDYPWGWATFHYGRWWNHPGLGWLWFPGTSWASSWVNWRCSPKFCGWAPLSPFDNPAFGVGAALGEDPSARQGFNRSGNADDFTFVPINRFNDPNVADFRVDKSQGRSLFAHSKLVSNLTGGPGGVTANQGFDPGRVEAISHQPVSRVNIQDAPEDMVTVPDVVFDNSTTDASGGAAGFSGGSAGFSGGSGGFSGGPGALGNGGAVLGFQGGPGGSSGGPGGSWGGTGGISGGRVASSAGFSGSGGSGGLSVFRPRLNMNTGPALSSAVALTIDPRFPQMRPGLLNTGQPTTAQSIQINPFFPQLRPGPFNPQARNQFFLAPFPSGANPRLPGQFAFNTSGFKSGAWGGMGSLSAFNFAGAVPNFAGPNTALVGTTGPLPAFSPPGTVPGSIGPLPSFSPPGTVPGSTGPLPAFSPPGTVVGSGGPGVAPFSPPGTVFGSSGGRVFQLNPSMMNGHAGGFHSGGGARGGGGGGHGGGGGGGHR